MRFNCAEWVSLALSVLFGLLALFIDAKQILKYATQDPVSLILLLLTIGSLGFFLGKLHSQSVARKEEKIEAKQMEEKRAAELAALSDAIEGLAHSDRALLKYVFSENVNHSIKTDIEVCPPELLDALNLLEGEGLLTSKEVDFGVIRWTMSAPALKCILDNPDLLEDVESLTNDEIVDLFV